MVQRFWKLSAATHGSLKLPLMALFLLTAAYIVFVHYRTFIVSVKPIENSHSISAINKSEIVIAGSSSTVANTIGATIRNWPPPTNVLYIAKAGRLGNKLFELASAYVIARKNNRRLVASTDFEYLKPIFPNLNMTFGRIPSFAAKKHEVGGGIFTKWMFNLSANIKHIHIVHNFQSFKYFEDCNDDTRRRFAFSPSLSELARTTLKKSALFKELGKEVSSMGSAAKNPKVNVTFIGIHVRHGDFAIKEMQAMGYALPKQSYYSKAMSYYRSRYSNCLFVVGSERKAETAELGLFEAGEVSSGNVTFLDDTTAHAHLAILSKCNHSIISAGSFSWWAGYLTGGTVIYFVGWPAPNSELRNYIINADYYPSHWIPMDD